MNSTIANVVTIGKKNKYNIPERTFTDAAGKQTIYRFYYPANDKALARVIEIVEQSFIRPLTDSEFRYLVSCLWIVEHKSTEKQHSKLDGIKSISTSCLDNKFCLCRMQDCNSICHNCYAGTQQERQHGLKEHNIINGIILRNVLIPVDYYKALALYNERFIRIESFGDVANDVQAENYCHIMQAFANATFAVWTKNLFTWLRVFVKYGKPANCVFIVSSCYKNIIATLKEDVKSLIDHIFTVYTAEYVKAHNVKINCGGRACKECIAQGKRCFFRNTEFHISELLK